MKCEVNMFIRIPLILLLSLALIACGGGAVAAPDTAMDTSADLAAPVPTMEPVEETSTTQSEPTTDTSSVEVSPQGVRAEGAISYYNGASYLNVVIIDNETGTFLRQTWLKVRANGVLAYDDWVSGTVQVNLAGTAFTQLDLEVYDKCTISFVNSQSTLLIPPDGIKVKASCTY